MSALAKTTDDGGGLRRQTASLCYYCFLVLLFFAEHGLPYTFRLLPARPQFSDVPPSLMFSYGLVSACPAFPIVFLFLSTCVPAGIRGRPPRTMHTIVTLFLVRAYVLCPVGANFIMVGFGCEAAGRPEFARVQTASAPRQLPKTSSVCLWACSHVNRGTERRGASPLFVLLARCLANYSQRVVFMHHRANICAIAMSSFSLYGITTLLHLLVLCF